jgi:hypothetical protein
VGAIWAASCAAQAHLRRAPLRADPKYGPRRPAGLAVDMPLVHCNSSTRWQASILADGTVLLSANLVIAPRLGKAWMVSATDGRGTQAPQRFRPYRIHMLVFRGAHLDDCSERFASRFSHRILFQAGFLGMPIEDAHADRSLAHPAFRGLIGECSDAAKPHAALPCPCRACATIAHGRACYVRGCTQMNRIGRLALCQHPYACVCVGDATGACRRGAQSSPNGHARPLWSMDDGSSSSTSQHAAVPPALDLI